MTFSCRTYTRPPHHIRFDEKLIVANVYIVDKRWLEMRWACVGRFNKIFLCAGQEQHRTSNKSLAPAYYGERCVGRRGFRNGPWIWTGHNWNSSSAWNMTSKFGNHKRHRGFRYWKISCNYVEKVIVESLCPKSTVAPYIPGGI